MARNDNTNDFVRLKRYALTNMFIKLDETRGIIENISNSLVEISSQPERGKGVVLYPGQTYKIRGLTYAAGEPKEHSSAAIAVEGGAVQESGGGSSSSDTPDITPALDNINATLQLMNTSISNANFGSNCSCNFGGLASEATHERIADALESLAGADFGRGNGLSAYEVALGNGFKGTVQEWLESLKGESYSLPVASDSILGGVKIGSTLTVDSGGTLNLSTGTSSILGGVKSSSLAGSVTINPDGTMKVNSAGDWGLLKLDSIGYYVEFNDPDEEEETEAESNE